MLLEYTLPALLAATVILSSTARNAIATRWQKLLDPYRPELHYMRGPGPKWRAKHNPYRRAGIRPRRGAPARAPATISAATSIRSQSTTQKL